MNTQAFARFITVAALLVAIVGCSSPQSPLQPKTAPELEQAAIHCMSERNWECAESDWSQYIKLRPNDGRAIANYGFALHFDGNDQAAIRQFETAISQGEGTYDLFAAYADSLANIGRTKAAIDWSYKALQLVPSLVDVRGNLAKLLVHQKKYYEALALLAEFDQHLEAEGHPPYFKGQRIAIESTAPRRLPANDDQQSDPLRMVEFNGHFFAPVRIGESPVAAFVVDTGASTVTLDDDFLVASKAKYTIARVHAPVKIADGSVVDAKLVAIDHMEIGNYELDDVPAVVCGTCALLLGENVLSHFDMSATKVQGVNALTLHPHTGIPDATSVRGR
ncbi:MAG: retroviral-like aspartic protease family protein [Xanthomonadales bacterium]|nr:retroviral-like aspartic protease family protein [Xanthomonadales bacterium]